MALTQRGRLRVCRHGNGWMAKGPDFYVWDEDGEEVQRMATALLSEEQKDAEDLKMKPVALNCPPPPPSLRLMEV